MAFMIPEYAKGKAWSVETESGEGGLVLEDLVPTKGYRVGDFTEDPNLLDALADYVEGGDVVEAHLVQGWFVHLSAPGYMDQTEWDGPFKTKKEAMTHLEDTFEVDPVTGEQ